VNIKPSAWHQFSARLSVACARQQATAVCFVADNSRGFRAGARAWPENSLCVPVAPTETNDEVIIMKNNDEQAIEVFANNKRVMSVLECSPLETLLIYGFHHQQ